MKKLSRFRLRLSLFKSIIFFVACNRETSNLDNRPNILFITTDYQAWEDTPELTPGLEMPALNKMCEEGVVFEKHYCTAPISMPSRYTIVSGRYPHYHKMMDNGGDWLPEETPVMMEKMSEAGYQTVGIGKMHFKPWDRMAGFETRIIADLQGNSARDTLKQDDYYHYLKKAGLTRWDYLKYQDSTDIFGVFNWPLHDTLDIDYFVGEESVKFVNKEKLSKKTPWFLWVSFNGPHNPWDPPKELMDKYMNADLPEARSRPIELQEKPFDHTLTRYNYTRQLPDYIEQNPELEHDIIKRIRAGHYGGLTLIDQQIGRIIEALEEKGELDNTIVVFSADHGAHLGDHHNFHKGLSYERSSHVPFIVWWPGKIKPGRVRGFSSHVDIFPTFVEIAQGKLPESLEGKSLLPVLLEEKEAESHAFIEILNDYSIVTEDYKLGLYTPYNEGELYDRQKDPDELYNVYYEDEYSGVVDSLTSILYEFHPPLKEIMSDRKDYNNTVKPLTVKSGDRLSGDDVPLFQENPLAISVSLKINKNSTGPIITYNVGNTHGFSIYLEEGKLLFGIRKWGQDSVYEMPGYLINGKNHIEIKINNNGQLFTIINGKKNNLINTIWPLPLGLGKKEFHKGVLYSGIAGDSWLKPFGNLEKGQDLDGHVISAKIELSNPN